MAVQKSTYSVKQLRDRVRGDLGLRSSNLILDEDVDAWAYDAQTAIANLTHWYRTTVAVATVANQALYDLPADCIALEEVWHNDIPLCQIRLVDFYREHPLWRQDGSGVPTHWYLRGTTAYGLHVPPSGSVAAAIDLFYTAIPPALTLNTDFYYIPTALQDAIVAYCKFMASDKDANGEGNRRVERWERIWEQWKQKAMAYVGNVAEGEHCVVGGFGSDWDGNEVDSLSYRTIPAP
jgi:hypothetical protein